MRSQQVRNSLLVVERVAKSGSPDTVATVGIFDVLSSRAVNSIPSRVLMSVDVRDTDLTRRDGVVDNIRASAKEDRGRKRGRGGARDSQRRPTRDVCA